MGFVSNQWLNRGWGLRNRGYRPVRVTIECEVTDDSWSRRNDVKVQITAGKSDGEFQTLFLSQAEADEVAATVVSCMSQREREKLLNRFLQDLSDAKLLKTLARDLKNRVRLPKDS